MTFIAPAKSLQMITPLSDAASDEAGPTLLTKTGSYQRGESNLDEHKHSPSYAPENTGSAS